jgi:hypothetical protein
MNLRFTIILPNEDTPIYKYVFVATVFLLDVFFLFLISLTSKDANLFMNLYIEQSSYEYEARYQPITNFFLAFTLWSLLYVNSAAMWKLIHRKPGIPVDLCMALFAALFYFRLEASGQVPLGKALDFGTFVPPTQGIIMKPATPNTGDCEWLNASKIEDWDFEQTYIGRRGCSQAFADLSLEALEATINDINSMSNSFFFKAVERIESLDDDAEVFIPNADACQARLKSAISMALLPACDDDCQVLPLCQSRSFELEEACGPLLDNWMLREMLMRKGIFHGKFLNCPSRASVR